MQMKGVISVVLFILLRCHLGSALNCYSCSGECENKNSKTCEQGEKCMIQESYDANKKLQDRKMNCQNNQYCNNVEGVGSVRQKCCDTDMCNDPQSLTTTNAAAGGADVSRDTPLQCYVCESPCVEKAQKTCRNQELCLTKTWKLAGVDHHKRGCANNTMCNKETTETMMGTSYAVKNECCNSNLCNSAVHLEVPAVALLAAIVAAWISKL